VLPDGVVVPANSLVTLNVRYNMLSGPLDDSLCSIDDVGIAGNSMLCGARDQCHLHMETVPSKSSGVYLRASMS
jgi:hypothetical protein